jgi:hypothetical protein
LFQLSRRSSSRSFSFIFSINLHAGFPVKTALYLYYSERFSSN